MKRTFLALGLLAILPLAACGDTQEEAVVVEEQPVTRTDPNAIDPAVTEGTIMMDTSGVGTRVEDDEPFVADTTTTQP